MLLHSLSSDFSDSCLLRRSFHLQLDDSLHRQQSDNFNLAVPTKTLLCFHGASFGALFSPKQNIYCSGLQKTYPYRVTKRRRRKRRLGFQLARQTVYGTSHKAAARPVLLFSSVQEAAKTRLVMKRSEQTLRAYQSSR